MHHVTPFLRHLSTSLVCTGVAAAVAFAPMQAQASQPLPVTATMSAGMSPTAAKLRTIMSFSLEPSEAPEGDAPVGDEGDGAEAAPEGPVAVAEGPESAPAPSTAPSTAPRPPPTKGLGMMISGAVVTGAVALPLIGYGAYIIVVGKRVDDAVDGDGVVQSAGNVLGGVVLAFGVIALAVGAPLLGVGASRFSKYQKWKDGQQVKWSPSSGRTAHGTWTTGVTLRF